MSLFFRKRNLHIALFRLHLIYHRRGTNGKIPYLRWFGDLAEHRLLQQLNLHGPSDEAYQRRLAAARQVGASQGFSCSRPGLLTPSREEGCWLTRVGFSVQPGELVFAPEQLYRGCLYGAALATIALTNGSRVNELLQVSLDRRKSRTETLVVTRDGKSEQRKTTLHLQHLLPKGARTDEERQYFLLSPHSVTLLGEILQLLVKEHGQVPIVHPPARGSKSEYLQPERYLFQWAASPDGQTGILDIKDTVILLRFLLHGLELYTAQGEPIKVTTHLLRHVTATVMREEAVPAEAIQWTLHHQPGRSPSDQAMLSAATEYYTRMPEEKRMQYLHRFQLSVEGQEAALEIAMPDERQFAVMDEKLRAVFERWAPFILPILDTVVEQGCALAAIIGRCVLVALTWFLIRRRSRNSCIGSGCTENWLIIFARLAASEMRSKPKHRPGIYGI